MLLFNLNSCFQTHNYSIDQSLNKADSDTFGDPKGTDAIATQCLGNNNIKRPDAYLGSLIESQPFKHGILDTLESQSLPTGFMFN